MRNRLMPMGAAVIAAALAGCGHTAAQARPALAGTSVGTPARPTASAPAGSPVLQGKARSPRVPHASRSVPTSASASTSASPPKSPPPSSGGGGAPLADGLYVDAPDGKPHYVVAVSRHSAAITGSIAYLYQDGRAGIVIKYTGKLSGNGRLSIKLSDGRSFTGTYRLRQFTLASCGRFLTATTQPGACHFAYHGYVP